jgi:uncharacterized OB-fold protein
MPETASTAANAIENLVSEVTGTGRLTLHGARCRRCQEVLFPAMSDCPLCLEPDVMEEYEIAGHGTIRDSVIAERGPSGFEVPYVQAWVRLDAGPAVFSIIETDEPRKFAAGPGTAATMVRRHFGPGDAGFAGWKFVVDQAAHG